MNISSLRLKGFLFQHLKHFQPRYSLEWYFSTTFKELPNSGLHDSSVWQDLNNIIWTLLFSENLLKKSSLWPTGSQHTLKNSQEEYLKRIHDYILPKLLSSITSSWISLWLWNIKVYFTHFSTVNHFICSIISFLNALKTCIHSFLLYFVSAFQMSDSTSLQILSGYICLILSFPLSNQMSSDFFWA